MNISDFKVKDSPGVNCKFLLVTKVTITEQTGYPEDPITRTDYSETFQFSHEEELKEAVKILLSEKIKFFITKYSPVNANIEISFK